MTMREVLVRRCEIIVTALVGNELAKTWWMSYNKAFDMSPCEMIEKDVNRVYEYLTQVSEGEW